MSLKLGNKAIKDVYLGDKKIAKIYLGSKLVYEANRKSTIKVALSSPIQDYIYIHYYNGKYDGSSSLYSESFTIESSYVYPNFKEIVLNPPKELNYNRIEFCTDLGNDVIIHLDVSGLDTSKLIYMDNMFTEFSMTSQYWDIYRLGSLILGSKFNTSKVKSMDAMFYGANVELTDFSNFDTSEVTSMNNMFGFGRNELSTEESLDLSSFHTPNLVSVDYMFYSRSSLKSLDLSNFDISKVTSMNDMFFDLYRLTHIKCKQAFKDWCLANQSTISLPYNMREGGSGTWEIV